MISKLARPRVDVHKRSILADSLGDSSSVNLDPCLRLLQWSVTTLSDNSSKVFLSNTCRLLCLCFEDYWDLYLRLFSPKDADCIVKFKSLAQNVSTNWVHR